MTSLKKAFGAGQLPAKFTKSHPVPRQTEKRFAHHERNIEALQRFSRTLAKPEQASDFEVATLRAAMAAHGICPDCGGHVHVDTEAEIIIQGSDEREEERRQAPVAFCSGCELSIEMPKEDR